MIRSRHALCFACLVLALFAAVRTPAQNRVWLGTQSTDWQNPANWDVGLPISTRNASIPFQGNVSLSSGTANTGSLFIGRNVDVSGGLVGGSTLTVSNGASLNATWIYLSDSQNTLVVNGTGTQVVTGGNGLTADSDSSVVVSGGANLNTEAGNLDLSSGKLTITGIGSNLRSSDGLQTILGQTLLTDGGTLDVRNTSAPGSGFLFVQGSLSIGAETGSAAAAPGTLLATQIQDRGGSVVFNHTSAAYTFAIALVDINGYGLSLTHLAGQTTLTGANSLTRAVTISGGTLRVNSTLGTGDVIVNGGTLGGTGQIDGLTTINAGATLAPGNSPGTLTFTNGLTLNDGAVLNFELGTANDLLRISGGTLTGSASAGGITLNLSDSGGFAPATYTLFDFTGATLSDFDVTDFTIASAPTGYTYSFALTGSSLELTATAVPEPATYAALAGLGALGLAAVRRRRRA